jgi:hypothetical protein
LVVRKHKGLSRQIWHACQDQSITALVYHPQNTFKLEIKGLRQHQASRRNTKNLQTPSSYTKKATTPSQQKLPEKLRLFKTPICELKNLLALEESFRAY